MTYHDADPSACDSRALSDHGHARRGETMRLKIRASMTLILCLLAGLLAGLQANTAGAQFLKYTPPGGPEQVPESRQESLERSAEEARYHLGPVRIAPWATLRDIAYVRSIFSTETSPPNDLTATAGLGLRAFLRNGSKVLWTAQVLPEYVWWQKQSDRQQLNGRYGLGFHGFFNRLTLEVQAGREQQQQIVNPEVLVPASSRTDGGEILSEVELTGATSVFLAASLNQQQNLVDDFGDPRVEELALLDREERVTRAGLRWRPRRRWLIGLGAERSEASFDHDALDRSNSGTSPVAEVRFQGVRLQFQTDVAARSLAARRGAAFVPYDKITGHASVSVRSPRRLSATLYTQRDLVYSLSSTYAYFDDERLGLAVGVGLGFGLSSRIFAEGGSNAYTPFETGAPRRRDGVSSYGASLSMSLPRNLSFGLQAMRMEFDSDLPGSDRSYTTVGTTIRLGGL